MIASFFVVKVLANSTSAKLANLNKEIEEQKNELSIDSSSKVTNFQNELLSLKTILKNHIIISEAISTIAQNTHQQINFSSFKINYIDKKIEIDGEADNNEVVAQAGYVFANLPNVSSIEIKNLKTTNSGVSFTMVLEVLEKFFN